LGWIKKKPFKRYNVESLTDFSIYLSNKRKIMNIGRSYNQKIVWNHRGELQFSSKNVKNSNNANYLSKK